MPKPSKANVAQPEPTAPERRQPRSNGKHPGGRPPIRPSAYDDNAVSLVFDDMIAGKQISDACLSRERPVHTAIYQRQWRDAEFAQTIARVREAQQHAIIDTIIPMADAATPENWQAVKLKIWARQWAAAKFCPKVFGEKSELHLTVSDALSDRLTAALKRQRELAAGIQIDGVAEPLEALPAPVDNGDKG